MTLQAELFPDETPKDFGRICMARLCRMKRELGRQLSTDECANVINEELKLWKRSKSAVKRASPTPAERPRDLGFETLCELSDCALDQLTPQQRGAINKALAGIRTTDPGVTPDEIRARAAIYRRNWPNITFTASGLAGKWAQCRPKHEADTNTPAEAPDGWEEAFRALAKASNWTDETIAGVLQMGWARISNSHRQAIVRELNDNQPINSR